MNLEARFKQPRNAKSQFQTFEQHVKELMQREAKEYQNEVAEFIEENIKRKQDSTGRLVAGTRAEWNREVLQSTWVVGIPSRLNSHNLKYWRLVEQGSAGLYGGGVGFSRYPLLFRPGGFDGGRQFRSLKRGGITLKQGRFVLPDSDTHFIRTHREIPAQHAYHTVFKSGNWGARIKKDFMQLVGEDFLR